MAAFSMAVDSEEIQAGNITVYISIWSEQRRKAAFEVPAYAGAYALVVTGRGHHDRHWGAGYAMSDDALRAFAVERLLGRFPNEQGILVHTKGLIEHVRLPDGHIRKARRRPGHRTSSGNPYDAFPQFDAITTEMDKGRWSLQPVDKRDEPHGYRIAQRIAETLGREAAERHRPLFSHFADIHPRNYILATDEDPAPFNLTRPAA